jgi:hypothetical protein
MLLALVGTPSNQGGEYLMKFQSMRIALAILFSLGVTVVAQGDIKVRTKTTFGGTTVEGTTYIKGARQRASQGVRGAMSFDTIYQCDLKRIIHINDRAKKYFVTPLEGETAASPVERPQADKAGPTRRGGVITYTTTVTDTGERKDLFGFKARRIKTAMTADSTPDACNPTKMRVESDGWYIDLEYGLYCSSDKPYVPPIASGPRPECQDEIRFKTTGSARLGYPVLLNTTIYGQDGRTTATTLEVVELSAETLDASLFDIPAGYAQANGFQELMGVPSVGTMSEPRPQATPSDVQTKRPGEIRVGVVAINNKTDRSVSTDTVRSSLIGNITGSGIEAVPLDSTSPAAIEAEARQKGCDYILYTDIAELKKSGSKAGGLLGRATGVGIAKERFEAHLDFRLFATGSTSPQLTSSSKSKEEGPELVSLSAAAGQEAKTVVSEIQKKR